MDPGTCVSLGGGVGLCGYMWRSDVVEVLGGTRESHDVHRFIHHSSSIKLTRALPPIQQRPISRNEGAAMLVSAAETCVQNISMSLSESLIGCVRSIHSYLQDCGK
jgi:hypothetical protein